MADHVPSKDWVELFGHVVVPVPHFVLSKCYHQIWISLKKIKTNETQGILEPLAVKSAREERVAVWATGTVCNVLHGWPTGQKNEQQNDLPSTKKKTIQLQVIRA